MDFAKPLVHRAYVAITVHLEVDGSPLCLLLDLVEVAESHNGVNLAKAFAKVLQEFGIEHKHVAHRVSCQDLEHYLQQCLQQRYNDCAPGTLHPFDVAKAKADGVLDEAEQELQDLMQDLEDINVAPDLEEMEDEDGEMRTMTIESLTETERVALDASVRPVKLILLKVRTLEHLSLAHRIMPRDWNSTYDMLAFALDYRQAIDDITGDRSLGLWNFELKEKEWEIAEQLCGVLKVLN
ncbi:hypothetical protein PLICRDRAFT_30688 [Plicaturopsis crispa FD-325 SS-3]|nr:hypothetical protein PLICRDRAFT_30688 [Plicaturopsis crispa FD-325 SS-3]